MMGELDFSMMIKDMSEQDIKRKMPLFFLLNKWQETDNVCGFGINIREYNRICRENQVV